MCDFHNMIPSPSLLKNLFPAPSAFIHEQRHIAKAIAEGRDPRLLILVGPCSIHDEKSAIEYASNLKQLAQEVQDSCFLILRAFFEKPRTARGWNGLLNDPDLDSSCDMAKGLYLSRKLLKTFADMQLPTACEFLDPNAAPYLSDLVTWGIIGARTCSSPLHRGLVSSLPMACGFKNSLDGSWEQAINGIVTARESLGRLTIDSEGRICQEFTKGNPHAYLILRGSTESPNCDKSSIENALLDLDEAGLPSRLMVDCAHGNSGKCPQKQIDVFRSVIELRNQDAMKGIFGVLLESFIEEGRQTIDDGKQELLYGVSVTDPCLDWSTTRLLIEEAVSVAHPSR
jgi:3-deoxy-7-phosphoheptulonate synthase